MLSAVNCPPNAGCPYQKDDVYPGPCLNDKWPKLGRGDRNMKSNKQSVVEDKQRLLIRIACLFKRCFILGWGKTYKIFTKPEVFVQ